MSPDPFLDDAATHAPAPQASAGPVFEQKDNWVSFSFNSAPGYDKIGATVHGDPEFVAKVFAVDGFNGKISMLMKQAVLIDEYFKKQYGADQPGKS